MEYPGKIFAISPRKRDHLVREVGPLYSVKLKNRCKLSKLGFFALLVVGTMENNILTKVDANSCVLWRYHGVLPVKPGIYLRQKQAKAQRGSLSSASIDGATNQATCLRGCHNPSHWLLVDQSEVSPRNSPPHAQYGWNIPRLAETEKHSLVRGMVRQGCRAAPRLASSSSIFPA